MAGSYALPAEAPRQRTRPDRTRITPNVNAAKTISPPTARISRSYHFLESPCPGLRPLHATQATATTTAMGLTNFIRVNQCASAAKTIYSGESGNAIALHM
jgi:hypothetical protein